MATGALYTHLARVYDLVFPFPSACVDAIAAMVPEHAPRRLIDAGAATGALVRTFSNLGWEALGIELDPEMVARAGPLVVQGSMLDICTIAGRMFPAGARFGAITCLGNTLPHIDPGSRLPFFRDARELLEEGAPLVIQMLNYAHPAVHPGYCFPEIRVGGVVFRRAYEAGPSPGTLAFRTELQIDCEQYRDSTTLYPLEPAALESLLHQAGFNAVSFFRGWDCLPFDAQHDFYLIAVAR
ncbi:MAG: class I SAM-dependent methyltransferase [Spirochaetaceae bacterium]|nr:class I SAM-dependent methyltransferase [Spirochaetaceae bacterium]